MLALPVVLAGAVRLALPVVEGAKPTVVAAGSFQQQVVDQLEARAQVAWVRDRDAVVERVGGVDDVIGVFGAPNQAVEVILEGNEPRALKVSGWCSTRWSPSSKEGRRWWLLSSGSRSARCSAATA